MLATGVPRHGVSTPGTKGEEALEGLCGLPTGEFERVREPSASAVGRKGLAVGFQRGRCCGLHVLGKLSLDPARGTLRLRRDCDPQTAPSEARNRGELDPVLGDGIMRTLQVSS